MTADNNGYLDTATQQSGLATVGSGPPAGFVTVSVTFPTAFTLVPNVVLCTPRSQDGTSYNDTFAATVRSVSTTGFVVT